MSVYFYNPLEGQFLKHEGQDLVATELEDINLKDATILLMENAISSVEVVMPIKQTKQIVKALPFALEDKLATEVEDNHIQYIGSVSGKAHALVATHNLMSTLEEQGIKFATSLASSLNIQDNRPSLLSIKNDIYIKTNALYSVCVPVRLLTFTLEQLRSADKIQNELNLCEIDELDPLQKAELTNLGFELFDADTAHVLPGLPIDKNLNLMTGPYKPKQIKTNKKPFKFKTPVAMAATVLVATLIGVSIETKQIEAKATAVKTASIDYYKRLFPNERVRERAFKRQFRDSVGDSQNIGGSATFTNLLAKSTKEISSNKNLEIDAVRYNKSKSVLELNLIAGNVGQLESLKSTLSSKNLSVEIASANQSGGKIKGLIKVKQNG